MFFADYVFHRITFLPCEARSHPEIAERVADVRIPIGDDVANVVRVAGVRGAFPICPCGIAGVILDTERIIVIRWQSIQSESSKGVPLLGS